MGEPANLHAEQFGEITGATIEVNNVSFGDLFAEQQRTFQTGVNAYDVIFLMVRIDPTKTTTAKPIYLLVFNEVDVISYRQLCESLQQVHVKILKTKYIARSKALY
jgi:hypothetical protein